MWTLIPTPVSPRPFPSFKPTRGATRCLLPNVAFSMHLGHHLREREVAHLIRNVGRFCRRFILLILLDLVRHPLPLALFRLFIAPLVCPIDAEDGQRSIRRSFTSVELHSITASALAGTDGSFRLSVAPLHARQVIDISYANAPNA